MSDHFAVVGQNNRNVLVQSKKIAPFHEDITRVQPFEPSSVNPGQYSRIKLDFKHALDREIILNDIRLRFALDFGQRPNTGNVFCVRGTDLIRELTVKINEDIVFRVDRFRELTHLFVMNGSKMAGERNEVRDAFLLHTGSIPSGWSPPFYYKTDDKNWYHNTALTQSIDDTTWKIADVTQQGLERDDGLPRLIYSDVPTTGSPYKFFFNISLNQLVGPIFHRLHVRRIEFVQIDIMFEPWVSAPWTQKYLLFAKDPTTGGDHPYSRARFTDLEIRQYRTTLLDGIHGFTLPDHRMLSWLMHRYSVREYPFDFSDPNHYLDIQLNDWEIRSNIVRIWWMLAPKNPQPNGNGFEPLFAPCEPYEQLVGVEIRWKNDKVLDLDTRFQVYRHYTLSDNKRYSLNDPYVRFQRLLRSQPAGRTDDDEIISYTWNDFPRDINSLGRERYELPIYHVDLAMNIQSGVPGAEIVGGIVNDTSDYIIRLKNVLRDENVQQFEPYNHAADGVRNLYVWIEYQTLVNLAANSHQFQRGSQIVTKQLNII